MAGNIGVELNLAVTKINHVALRIFSVLKLVTYLATVSLTRTTLQGVFPHVH